MESIYTIAIQAAIEASQAILEIYVHPVAADIKIDGSPVTIADLTSSKIIEQLLLTTAIPIIGEESVNLPYSERKHWKQCWIVDPLDGTKEYLRRNGEFAVNIALVEDGIPLFGIIAHPVDGMIAYGGKSMGVYYGTFEEALNLNAPKVSAQELPNNPLVLACSRTPHQGEMKDFIHSILLIHPDLIELKKGSALKFIDILLGKADVYPRFAPTMEWDVASGQALIEGIGGKIINPETNRPLQYNKENLYNSWFVATHK